MIVMFHGLGNTATSMKPLQDMLSPRFETLAPTRRTFGPQMTFETIFDDVVRQLDEAKVGPAYYLGYSFGGFIALALAHRHPERVRGVIGIASPVFFGDRELAQIRRVLKQNFAIRPPGDEGRTKLEERWGAGYEQLLAVTEGIFSKLRAEPPLTPEDLKALQAPVLFLSGDHDIYMPAESARKTAEMMPNARLGLFPGPGHPIQNVPWLQIKHAVTTFIDQVESGHFDPKVPADVTANLVLGGLKVREGISAKLNQASMRRRRKP